MSVGFKILKCLPLPIHSFCFLLAFEAVSSQLPALAAMPAGSHISLPLHQHGLLFLWNPK